MGNNNEKIMERMRQQKKKLKLEVIPFSKQGKAEL